MIYDTDKHIWLPGRLERLPRLSGTPRSQRGAVGIMAQRMPMKPMTAAGPPTANRLGWWEADLGAYNDAGVTLATNGQTVRQWNDQSGNFGDNLAQATAGARPTYVTNVVNGHPALVFNPHATCCLQTTTGPTVADPLTVLMVLNQVTWHNSEWIFMMGWQGGSGANVYQNSSSPNLRSERGVAETVVNNGGLALNTWGLMTLTYSATTSKFKLAATEVTRPAGALGTPTSSLSLGYVAGLAADMKIAAMLLYNVEYATQTVTDAQTYLNTKYGL